MYKISYDSNTGETSKKEVPNFRSPTEFFLKSLCESNGVDERDYGAVLGPIAFGECEYGYYLISAWSGGRQWFYIVEIYSPTEFLGDEDSMYKLCIVPLLKEAGIQTFDEEDEDVSE